MTRLPVIDIVKAAYAFVWQERRQFWQLTLPPLVILAILSALVQWGTVTTSEAVDGVRSFSVHRSDWVVTLSFIMFVLNFWIWLSYSVAWHRSYLMPGGALSPADAYRPGFRQIRFFWTAVKILLLMIPGIFIFPLFAAFAAAGVALVLLGILAYGYIYGRLLLWLPAVALDDQLTFKEVWALSEGNGMRLLGIVVGTTLPLILLSLPALLLVGPLSIFAEAGNSLTAGLLSNLAFELLSFIGLAASISALSIAYGMLYRRS